MGRRSYEDIAKVLKKDPEKYRAMMESIKRSLLSKQPPPMKCYIDYTQPRVRPRPKTKQKPKRLPRVVIWRRIVSEYQTGEP